MKTPSLIAKCALLLAMIILAPWISRAQNILIDVRNVQVTNNAGGPTVTYDLWMSASSAYVAAIGTDPNNGLSNIDIAWEMNFGTTGSAAASTTTPIFPTSVTATGSVYLNSINPVWGTNTTPPGAMQAGNDTKYVVGIGRILGIGGNPEFSTTPVKVASFTVTFPAGTVIGGPADGAVIYQRTTTNATGTKWSDANGNTGQPVGSITANPRPLPVDLISFTAEKEVKQAKLTWVSANELAVNFYEVQRSVNGKDFNATVAKVASAGDHVASVTYNAFDQAPAAANNYYRLRIVDKGGKENFSPVRVVNFGTVSYSLSPNPAATFITVSGVTAGATVRVVDVYGKTVADQTAEGATAKLTISQLPAGTYHVQVINGEQAAWTSRFSKL